VHSTEPLMCFVLRVLGVMIRTAAHDCWMRAPRCAPVTPGGGLNGYVASSRAALGVGKGNGWPKKGSVVSVVVRKRIDVVVVAT
jgi:hypothetical protein